MIFMYHGEAITASFNGLGLSIGFLLSLMKTVWSGGNFGMNMLSAAYFLLGNSAMGES